MNEVFDFLGSNFVEVYSDEDTSKFDVGRVLEFDENWLLLQTIDRFGKFDGYMLLKRESIYKLSYNTNYIRALRLSNAADESSPPLERNNLFEHVLAKNIKKKNVVSATLVNGDTLLGILTKATENYLYIEIYMDNGQKDGVTIFLKEMISAVQFGIQECKRIQENIINIEMSLDKKQE